MKRRTNINKTKTKQLNYFVFNFKDPSSSFSNTRHSAIRLKHLPAGSVHFETVIETDLLGSVIQEINGIEPGLIGYRKDDEDKNIMFFTKDVDAKNLPKVGDKVSVDAIQLRQSCRCMLVN